MRMRKSIIQLILLLLIVSGCGNKITADECSEIKAGNRLSLDDVTFSVESINIRKEVKPTDPSGYYHYYEGKEGYRYFVIYGTASNHGSTVLRGDYVMIQGQRDSNTYTGRLVFSDQGESDLIQKLDKKATQKFYIILLLKNDQAPPTSLIIYFNDTFKKAEGKNYDHSRTWVLPDDKND